MSEKCKDVFSDEGTHEKRPCDSIDERLILKNASLVEEIQTEIYRKPLEILQISLEILRKYMEILRKYTDILRKCMEILRKSIEILRKCLEILRKMIETLRICMEFLRTCIEILRNKCIHIYNTYRCPMCSMSKRPPITKKNSNIDACVKITLKNRFLISKIAQNLSNKKPIC